MIRHVKMAFEKYADFSSRSTRSEFWWFVLAYTIIMILLSMIGGVLFFMSLDLANGLGEEPPAFGEMGFAFIPMVIGLVFILGTLIPYLALLVRRIHDTGNTGWLGILTFLPYIGFIALVVFGVMETQNRTNKWGPVPGEVGDEVSDALIDFDNGVV